MTIDKRINYAWGGPGGKSPGRGGPAGGATGGGGGGRDRDRPTPTRDRHPPAPRPAPAPVTTAKAPPSILSRPAPTTYKDPDPVTETVPGDVTFEPVERYTPPVRHHAIDTKEQIEEQKITDKLNRQNEIRDMIAQQQEEKYGSLADPTKFGETVKGPDLRTERETEEDWERAQDWDKIQKLSDRGHSSEEIQKAMEKGLLTKADPQSMRTNLLDRGLRSLRNIMPGTNLEKSLLGGLKKSFTSTEGGLFDPKRMALGALKNMALKKMGLGALNPLLGIASLFGFDPFKGLMNKFAKKPAFDIEEASKLGLYANRFPTEGGQFPTEKQYADSTVAEKIAMGDVDLEKLITGEDTGRKSMMEDFYANQGSWSERIGDQLGTNLQEAKVSKQDLARYSQQKDLIDQQKYQDALDTTLFGSEITPYEFEQMKKGKITEPGTYKKTPEGPVAVAHGGRIDKPLTGRSRDI